MNQKKFNNTVKREATMKDWISVIIKDLEKTKLMSNRN